MTKFDKNKILDKKLLLALSVQTVRYDLAECLLYCNCTQIVQKQPNFAIFAANKQFWRG